ncbi:hypothetical protein ISN44_As10g010540 [Arabidopsis suecica]|uniref:Uncharacterized protein n=1 Tax=Arabidopsis suecica TaxID=45249 RepID=A0A8T1ZWA4_ARASU|nr:hypothetical protein ISN44_As10g010540 [Arabidopsis suecica]
MMRVLELPELISFCNALFLFCLANTSAGKKNTLKGRPVQAPPIFEGKEPPQFVATFQHLVVLKGGLSSGYKNRMTEKGSSDGISCTYSSIRKISDALCFNKAETVRMEAKGVQDKGLIYTIKVTSTKTRSNKLGITKRDLATRGINLILSEVQVLIYTWLENGDGVVITPNEHVLFEDIKENCITLQDLKASKISGNVFKVYAST